MFLSHNDGVHVHFIFNESENDLIQKPGGNKIPFQHLSDAKNMNKMSKVFHR